MQKNKIMVIRLKEILEQKRITGSELARRLNVTPSYVNQACKGTVNLSLKKCEEIANALGVPMAALFDESAETDVVRCPHCGMPIRLIKD